jgi:hypothetical protein
MNFSDLDLISSASPVLTRQVALAHVGGLAGLLVLLGRNVLAAIAFGLIAAIAIFDIVNVSDEASKLAHSTAATWNSVTTPASVPAASMSADVATQLQRAAICAHEAVSEDEPDRPSSDSAAVSPVASRSRLHRTELRQTNSPQP